MTKTTESDTVDEGEHRVLCRIEVTAGFMPVENALPGH